MNRRTGITSLCLLLGIFLSPPSSRAGTEIYSSLGTSIVRIDPTGTVTSIATFQATSLAFAPSGDLYAGGSGTIETFSPTGQDLGTFATLPSHILVSGLAVSSAGDVYAATGGGAGGTVYEYSPSGQLLTSWVASLPSLPGDLGGLAIAGNGNVWVGAPVIGSGNGYVREYTATGQLLGTFFSGPSDGQLAFDTSGNLLITSNGNYVEAVSPTGQNLGAFYNDPTGDINGIAIGSSGDVYVADSTKVEILSSTGQYLGTLATSPTTVHFGQLAIQPASVPEPSSLILGVVGLVLGGGAGLARRRSTK